MRLLPPLLFAIASLSGCQSGFVEQRGALPTPHGAEKPVVVPPEEASGRTGVTDREIVLGSCLPLSGQLGGRGNQFLSGGKAYFDYVNDHGGVNGRKIKLITCDDKYDPAIAIECFDQTMKSHVFAGTLFHGSATAAKYVHLSDSYHVPMVGFGTGPEFIVDPPHPLVFQLRSSYRAEAAEQVNSLWDTLRRRRIAIVFQNDAYGASSRAAVEDALTARGGKPEAVIPIERLSDNVQPVIDQLNRNNADAVIVAASAALPLLAKRRVEIKSAPLLVAFSTGTDVLLSGAGKRGDGTIITQVVPLLQERLPSVQLHKKLMSQYANSAPTFSSFEGCLIAMVVVEGLKRAGRNLTQDKFVHALESMHHYDLGLGPNLMVNYTANSHEGLKGGIYWTIIKKGDVRSVTNWSEIK